MLDLLLDWLQLTLSAKSPKTVYNYGYALRRLNSYLIAAGYGELDLRTLRPLHIKRFYASLTVAHNTKASIDRALRAVFRRVQRFGIDDFDLQLDWRAPTDRVEVIQPRRVHKLALTEAQALQLLKRPSRRGFTAQRNHTLLSFLLMTGCRVSEALSMRRSDLDLARRIADLRTTKGARPRHVHLPPELVLLLSRYTRRWDRGEMLFPTRRGRPLSRRYVHRIVHRIAQQSGLEGVGPHTLRRTFVTVLHNRGAPLGFIQETCGHQSIKTTMGYLELGSEAKSALADQFANFRSTR